MCSPLCPALLKFQSMMIIFILVEECTSRLRLLSVDVNIVPVLQQHRKTEISFTEKNDAYKQTEIADMILLCFFSPPPPPLPPAMSVDGTGGILTWVSVVVCPGLSSRTSLRVCSQRRSRTCRPCRPGPLCLSRGLSHQNAPYENLWTWWCRSDGIRWGMPQLSEQPEEKYFNDHAKVMNNSHIKPSL